jgi:hypothetical protein
MGNTINHRILPWSGLPTDSDVVDELECFNEKSLVRILYAKLSGSVPENLDEAEAVKKYTLEQISDTTMRKIRHQKEWAEHYESLCTFLATASSLPMKKRMQYALVVHEEEPHILPDLVQEFVESS